jgi:hypothetical protein
MTGADGDRPEGPVPGARTRSLRADLADAAWLWFALRLGLGLLAVILFARGAMASPCQSDIATNSWETLPPLADQGLERPLVGAWQRADACWYSKIATYGYEAGEPSTAFFPLFPTLMRAGSTLLGGAIAFTGLVVAAVAFIFAVAGLRQLVREDFDDETSRRTVLYLSVFPAAFFFFAPFTESLFLAFTVWSILAARRRDWELAAVAGFLAGLTRVHGVLLVLPVAWEVVRMLRDQRAAGAGEGPSSTAVTGMSARSLLPFAAALAPVVAVGGYYLFTANVAGRSFLEAQDTWSGTRVSTPWDLVGAAWTRISESGDMITALNLVALVLFIGLFVAGVRRVPLSYSLYVGPSLALIALRSPAFPLMSAMRYVSVLFPCFVVLALLARSDRVHTGWVIVSALLLALLAMLFIQGEFIG